MADQVALAPADGLRVIWDRDAVGREDAWRLEGTLEPAFAALRVLSGRAADGSLLVLCAARPVAAAHHDEELVAAGLVDPDGEVHEVAEALLSTEYAADGSIRRLGLELYRPEADYPVRAAGDATEGSESTGDGLRRRRAVLDLRLDGSEGTALYEIVEPL
jgi:hypothetical protein